MPYKSEKQKLPPELDRRRKLNDAQKRRDKTQVQHWTLQS